LYKYKIGIFSISGSEVDKRRFQFRDFATLYQISSMQQDVVNPKAALHVYFANFGHN